MKKYIAPDISVKEIDRLNKVYRDANHDEFEKEHAQYLAYVSLLP